MTETSEKTIGYGEREACFLAMSIDDALLRLEIFRGKAKRVIPVLEQMMLDMMEDGLDERDHFRYTTLGNLVLHLKEIHNLE